MKRVILGLLLVAIATPAMAFTESEMEAAGRRNGRLSCLAIEKGASSLVAVVKFTTQYQSQTDSEIIERLNLIKNKNTSLLFKAFVRGSSTTLKPCKAIYNDLPVN